MAKEKKKKKTNISLKIRLIVNALFVIILLGNIITLPLKVNYGKSYIRKVVIKTYRLYYDRNKCFNDRTINDEVKKELDDMVNDLYAYLGENNISFKYVEENYDYEISFNDEEELYGASLIKLVDALYLLDNHVDLSKTARYEKWHQMGYSAGVSKYKVGSEIPIKDLMNYAISVSDNSAHLILIDYIGFDNLKEYGNKLGGKHILEGGDLFGNQSASDMIIYLKKAYEIINNNENGKLLKDAMLNNEVNYLNFDDVSFAHKYGSHNAYFHDVGIYFSDDPYYLAVLTTKDHHKEVVTEVSKKVFNIHNKLIELKTDYCNSL